MWIATVATYWTTDADGNNTPALTSFLQPGDSCEDVTGQDTTQIQPSPNAVTWRIRCAASTLDAIEADADHTVLTAEEEIEDAV